MRGAEEEADDDDEEEEVGVVDAVPASGETRSERASMPPRRAALRRCSASEGESASLLLVARRWPSWASLSTAAVWCGRSLLLLPLPLLLLSFPRADVVEKRAKEVGVGVLSGFCERKLRAVGLGPARPSAVRRMCRFMIAYRLSCVGCLGPSRARLDDWSILAAGFLPAVEGSKMDAVRVENVPLVVIGHWAEKVGRAWQLFGWDFPTDPAALSAFLPRKAVEETEGRI
jgi:hypothetical protein